jgi:hypothetical protein
MNQLIEKLSSYQILNNLIPGVLFVFFFERLTEIKVSPNNLLSASFVYYFFGSLISRIGSLFVDPILVKVNLLRLAPYKEFIKASKSDSKIEILSETNNMFRNFFSITLCLSAALLYKFTSHYFSILEDFIIPFSLIFVAGVFLFSYVKQTNYIVSRIEHVNNPNP